MEKLEHLIKVQVEGDGGGGGGSGLWGTRKITPTPNPSSAGLQDLIKKFLPIITLANYGHDIASAASSLVTGTISRIGERTGQTLYQNDIDNTFKGIKMGISAIAHPFSFAVNTYFAWSDFNLNVKKANNEARYMSILLGGKK